MLDNSEGARAPRVQVCVTTPQDASVILDILAQLGAAGQVREDAAAVAREIAAGADAAVMSEDKLSGEGMTLVALALRNQPAWSQIPLVIVAAGGVESAIAAAARRDIDAVVVLERPVRLATLSTVMAMALRSRARQYYVRDLLARLRERETELKAVNETLELRVAQRTRAALRLAEQLRALSAELPLAEARERRRISSILHDHIQQLLTAAMLRLQMALGESAETWPPPGAEEAVVLLRDAVDASRSLAVELSPPALFVSGLAGALSWLAEWIKDKYQFTVRVRTDERAEPAREDVRLTLFECVRELLLNARKHSGVSEASVVMEPAPAGGTRVTVEDKGRGFDLEKVRERPAGSATIGLFSVEQRLAHLSGTMEVASAPGKGTRVTLTVPLPRQGAATPGTAAR